VGRKLKSYRHSVFTLLVLTLLLMGALPQVVHLARASSHLIYIREDGSVYPPTPEIRTSETYGENYYCLNYNLHGHAREDLDYHSIVIEKDNIIFDGKGFILDGIIDDDAPAGIIVSGRKNVTIRNFRIWGYSNSIIVENSEDIHINGNDLPGTFKTNIIIRDSIKIDFSRNTVSNIETDAYPECIRLINSAQCTISQNKLILDSSKSAPEACINIRNSNGNIIYDNSISSKYSVGFNVFSSSGNRIFRNTVDSWKNICMEDSASNQFYQNNFLGNITQVRADSPNNTWDNGYPSGGNFWRDYNGTDFYTGPNQDLAGKDGLGDSPYFINPENVDNYPLAGVFNEFEVGTSTGYHKLLTFSNPEAHDFAFSLINQSQAKFSFKVDQTNIDNIGFCRVCVPKVLLTEPYTVRLDGEILDSSQARELAFSNSKYEYLYIEYPATEHVVEITGITNVTLIEKGEEEDLPSSNLNPSPSPSPQPSVSPNNAPTPTPSPSQKPSDSLSQSEPELVENQEINLLNALCVVIIAIGLSIGSYLFKKRKSVK